MEQNLVEFLTKTLDDLKAQDILAIDVRGKSSITDAMIIATGTSVRHVASTAERLATEAKQVLISYMEKETWKKLRLMEKLYQTAKVNSEFAIQL